MKKLLIIGGALLLTFLGLFLGTVPWRSPKLPPPVEPESWPVSDLPKHLYSSGQSNLLVRVAFQRHLIPTDDPLVFDYHPGEPPEFVPKNYRVHFSEKPAFGNLPVVVVGVASFEIDPIKRPNWIPGFVVLKDAKIRVSP